MNQSIGQQSEGVLLEHESAPTLAPTSPSKTYSSNRERNTTTTETLSAHKNPSGTEQSQRRSMPQTITRPRKSSLRRTTLLGGDSLRIRSSSNVESPKNPSGKLHVDSNTTISRRKSDISPIKRSSVGSSAVHTSQAQRLSSFDVDVRKSSPSESISSAGFTTICAQAPSPPGTYTSTTDDEESNPAAGITPTAALAGFTTAHTIASRSAPPLSSSDMPLALNYSQHRRSSKLPISSPLASVYTTVQSNISIDEEVDYSETARWGWVVLISTWIVFVVGMGSCLGVWSWAWDVGETPYAPPELEDDDTLPIVGYYPALMILTGAVMSWVWVVVAWVGMKYFRHAKMAGEDGP